MSGDSPFGTWSKVATLGMVIPPFNRNPYNGYINPYYWVDEFIPYYMEISWELIDPGTFGTCKNLTIEISDGIMDAIFSKKLPFSDCLQVAI